MSKFFHRWWSSTRTSFCIVNFTFMRFECGSVQMNPASINRTLFSPFNFFKHIANSSLDSGSAIVHVWGGERNRSQFLQNESAAANVWVDLLHQDWRCDLPCFGIPSVISTLRWSQPDALQVESNSTHEFRRQAMHKFAEFGSIGVPRSAWSQIKD